MRKRSILAATLLTFTLMGTALAEVAPLPAPACLPGQKPGVDCPLPPVGGGIPNQPGQPLQPLPPGQSGQPLQPGTPPPSAQTGGANNQPVAPTAPDLTSGFQSTYPTDRSVSFFSELVSGGQSTNYFAVSWDSSARLQLLPYISVEKQVTGVSNRQQHLCTSLDDPTCGIDKGWDSAFINSTIGNCATNPDSACVSKFSIVKADGTSVVATPVTKFPASYTEFSGGKMSNGGYLAPGLTPWIWKAGSDEFLLTGVIYSGAQSVKGMSKATSWAPTPRSFYFEVIPVIRETSSLIKAPIRKEKEIKTNGITYTQLGFDYAEEKCIANDVGVCLHRGTFADGARIKLSLQVPHNVSGWLNGRLLNPTASVTTKDSNLDILEVEAAPAQNIMGGAYVPTSSVTASDWKWLDDFQGPGSTAAFAGKQMKGGESFFYVGDSGEYGALAWFQAWSRLFGDKALRVNTTWTIQTTQSESTGGCVQPNSGLQGIVSTNAAVYDSGAPTQDKKTNTLTYRVAAPVNDASGKANVGTYSLSMNSALLKCLYSITSIPSQAQISITQSDGQTSVQTAALNTKNNWVNFAANNFNYSDLSLLQVKMSGTATPASASTTGAATSKSTTITCVKGKVKKSVKGINPTCPAGYKKT